MQLSLNSISKTGYFVGNKFRNIAASRTASWFLLLSFFFIVAAAAHSGFMAKWALREDPGSAWSKVFGIEVMLDGTAQRPFIYRQLVPALANAADMLTPLPLKNYVVSSIDPGKIYTKASSANQPSYEFRYRITYFLHFLALFLSLIFLRSIALSAGVGQMEASFGPSAFVLAFPYLQTIGGYFYDGVELAFLSAAVLLALKGKYWALLALTLVATYNKESFFFYLPTLYPLLRLKLHKKLTIAVLSSAMLLAGLVNLLVKIAFSNNVGLTAYFFLFDNIRNYVTPRFYHQFEVTYGMPGPKGAFFLTLTAVAFIVVRSWPYLQEAFRMHLALCFLINLPLFILFCATGELRNLSFLYVGFVICLSFAMKLYSSNNEKIPLEAGYGARDALGIGENRR